jgi:hypothetical protein
MGNLDLLCTLFLSVTWGGGTILGGLVGRWAMPPLIGFLIGAVVGTLVSAILNAILTWSHLFAGSEPDDFVLLYLPPALMAGLTAAAICETISLQLGPWKEINAKMNARATFRYGNTPANADAICKLQDRRGEDAVDYLWPGGPGQGSHRQSELHGWKEK